MPTTKIYAQEKLDLGIGKTLEQGEVIATIDSALPIETLVNQLISGRAAAFAPKASSKPAPENKPPAETKPADTSTDRK